MKRFIHSKHSLKPLLFFLCTGCTVGPSYVPPQVDMPNEWHTSPIQNKEQCNNESTLAWWETLNDPTLNSLICRAFQQNIDLNIAGMKILEARLLRKGKMAESYPRIDASAMGGDLYCSKDILKSGLFGNDNGHRRNLGFFEFGFDAEWEIDFFGYRRHQVNASEAKLASSEENLEDLWVTLSAEIARNYIELRGLQQRRLLLSQNIENLQTMTSLASELMTTGMATNIDFLKTEERLNELQAEKPLLELASDKTIHRLAILVGTSPGDLFCELSDPKELPPLPTISSVGVPSDLLRRRPDIRRAERELAAATEEVGTAVAALFPRFSLFGYVGEIGNNLRSLTNGNALTCFAAPQLLLPTFNSRLLQQDVKFNQIQAQEALLNYQKTILSALEEVENGLVECRYMKERNQYLGQAQSLSKQVYELNVDLYQKGIQNYQEVLASARALLVAEDLYLQNEVQLLMNYIALYKALGGGWD